MAGLSRKGGGPIALTRSFQNTHRVPGAGLNGPLAPSPLTPKPQPSQAGPIIILIFQIEKLRLDPGPDEQTAEWDSTAVLPESQQFLEPLGNGSSEANLWGLNDTPI